MLEPSPGSRIPSAWRQAMPLSRVVLHYRMGLPSLGKIRPVAWLLGALERIAELLPRSIWAYFVVLRHLSQEAGTSCSHAPNRLLNN